MPNHVKNRVWIMAEEPDVLYEIEDRYKYDPESGDEDKISWPDFNKIVQMPDDDDFIRGDLTMEALRASNGRNWYDWSARNWGTKWNSYSHELFNPISRDSIGSGWSVTYTFETAWSSVPDLIQQISEEYPEVDIFYGYADEDTGHNCGKMWFKKGKLVDEFIPAGGTKSAYELSFALWPDRDFAYKWDEEKQSYVYDESMEVW